ncbi:MAG: phosphopantetheine-binding protein [Chloroflexota bacterium]|nr:phosphopantetheine-binding protein [Chloroflexota bacterium]MDQ2940124.1 phosphopantetheine-binding protein [Actinomycetota bacterium]
MEPIATPSREQIATRIQGALVEFGADREKLRLEATLEELDIDSLDLFELGQILHQEFGIEVDPEDFEDVSTLGDAQEAMLSYVK